MATATVLQFAYDFHQHRFLDAALCRVLLLILIDSTAAATIIAGEARTFTNAYRFK